MHHQAFLHKPLRVGAATVLVALLLLAVEACAPATPASTPPAVPAAATAAPPTMAVDTAASTPPPPTAAARPASAPTAAAVLTATPTVQAPTAGVAPAARATTATEPSQPAAAMTVQVVMNEWDLKPDAPSTRAGTVTFEVANQGKLPHELIVVKTDRPLDNLVMEADGARVEETAPGQDTVGEVEDIPSGQTKSGTLQLVAGRYALVCNIAGHYKAGMVSAFEVK